MFIVSITGGGINIVRLVLLAASYDTAPHNLIGFDLPPWRPLYYCICVINKADQMNIAPEKV